MHTFVLMIGFNVVLLIFLEVTLKLFSTADDICQQLDTFLDIN
jgi:hypothetical protein